MIRRRFAGLTVLFVGLAGAFSALTLVALGRRGAALGALAAGVLVALAGTRILVRAVPPDREEP